MSKSTIPPSDINRQLTLWQPPEETPFERAKHIDENGIEYWLGRELMSLLEYRQWQNFEPAIKRAMTSYETGGGVVSDHFMPIHELIVGGKGNKQKSKSYKLTRYACYLIAMNGDPSKPAISAAQQYFATQTRKQELGMSSIAQLPPNPITRKQLKSINRATDSGYSYDEGRRWDAAREGLKEANKRVSAVRKASGLVTTSQHYAALADQDFLVGITVSRDEWMTLHGIYKDINEHLSTLDLVALTYAKEAIADLYAKHQPKTYTALFEIANQICDEVARVRRVHQRLEPNTPLIDNPRPVQKALKGGSR